MCVVLQLWPTLAAAQAAPTPRAAKPAPARAPTTAPAPSASPPAPLGESLRGMARADYAAARILYEDGDFQGALTKLEAAHQGSKDPRLLWNMASCEKELRHYSNVIALLERYLREGAALITDEERAATGQLVETVRAFVNELTLSTDPAGADVSIDGVKVGTTPLEHPLRIDMGKRRLGLRKEGFLPHEAELDLVGGKNLTLAIELMPELHEGTLRVISDTNAVISIDGRVVGTATWVGQLSSGSHSIHVNAPGKQPHKTEVVIKDNDTSSLHVNLLAEPSLLARSNEGSGALWWVLGGVALAAGAGVGAFFILREDEQPSQPELGTWGGFEL